MPTEPGEEMQRGQQCLRVFPPRGSCVRGSFVRCVSEDCDHDHTLTVLHHTSGMGASAGSVVIAAQKASGRSVMVRAHRQSHVGLREWGSGCCGAGEWVLGLVLRELVWKNMCGRKANVRSEKKWFGRKWFARNCEG